jgi:arylsulfatase A-like enzyme
MIGLTLVKPRVRRLLSQSGFFHRLQKDNVDFVMSLAQSGIPADDLALETTLARMRELQDRKRPYFLFINLYDVHAPYAPQATSPMAPFPSGLLENLVWPFVMSRVTNHAYLKPGFKISRYGRTVLRRRYARAVALMSDRLARFRRECESRGLLDDTLLVITSDHGEAFGDHGLYFHDASVWQTHLHVPLWIHHPAHGPGRVDDVVSTRALYDLLLAAATRRDGEATLLDAGHRAEHAVALAEHFHYPHAPDALPEFRQDLAAAVVGRHKVVLRSSRALDYDLIADPHEETPLPIPLGDVGDLWRSHGAATGAVRAAERHLTDWQRRQSA